MALYGHPEAGGYWEQHCEEQVLEAGFSLACEEWPGCYWHEELKCFLVVYVDDMKMSGPKANLAEAWTRLRKNLKMDDPEPSGRYLGCEHEIKKVSVDGKSYTTMTYNMEEFLDSCLAKYTEVAGGNVKFKHVPTPFLDDFVKKGPRAPSGDGIWHECPWCCGRFSPEEFKVGQGKSYKDQSANGCSRAERPATPEVTDRGELANDASSVLMKVLYGARMARFDLLRAVCALATCVTKWDHDCDRKLHRLMCYIWSTKHYRLIGWVGDNDVDPNLYTDADFAGNSYNMRSTSGVHMELAGPHTKFPTSGQSKGQTAVSWSTPESELVAGA